MDFLRFAMRSFKTVWCACVHAACAIDCLDCMLLACAAQQLSTSVRMRLRYGAQDVDAIDGQCDNIVLERMVSASWLQLCLVDVCMHVKAFTLLTI